MKCTFALATTSPETWQKALKQALLASLVRVDNRRRGLFVSDAPRRLALPEQMKAREQVRALGFRIRETDAHEGPLWLIDPGNDLVAALGTHWAGFPLSPVGEHGILSSAANLIRPHEGEQADPGLWQEALFFRLTKDADALGLWAQEALAVCLREGKKLPKGLSGFLADTDTMERRP